MKTMDFAPHRWDRRKRGHPRPHVGLSVLSRRARTAYVCIKSATVFTVRLDLPTGGGRAVTQRLNNAIDAANFFCMEQA
jgi:hypothetical protein